MTAASVAVVRRPRRRTHLADVPGDRVHTWCGLDVPAKDAHGAVLDLNGGATVRLVAELRRELDETTCLRCTRLAVVILSLHSARDGGRPAW